MRALAALSLGLTGCLSLLCGYPDDDVRFILELPVPPNVDLVAVQDGDGPWTEMTPGPDGKITVEILGTRAGYAYVCPYPGGPGVNPSSKQVPVQFLTRRDDPQPNPCLAPSSVQLTVNQSGDIFALDVFVGHNGGTDTLPFPVPAGTWEVVVLGRSAVEPQRVLLTFMRNVVLQADTTLVFDVGRDSRDLLRMTLPVVDGGGAVDDVTWFTSRVVFPSGTRATLGTYDAALGSPSTPLLPPEGTLVGDDLLLVEAAGGSNDVHRMRGHQRPAFGQPTGRYELPSHVDARLDASGATWSGDWDVTRLELLYQSQGPTPPIEHYTHVAVVATRRWLREAAAGNALPRFDPTTLPGWDPSWAPPPTYLGWNLRAWTGDLDGELVWAEGGDGGEL